MRHEIRHRGRAATAAVMALCLAAQACASRLPTAAQREKWCGIGGGAAIGALTPPAISIAALGDGNGGGVGYGGGYILLLGLLLAPVGALVGAIDGAVNNPCPAGPAQPTGPVMADETRTPAESETP